MAANGSRCASDTDQSVKLRRNARVLESMIAAERVDIVHAQSAGGAWSARTARRPRSPVWLVTTLPDVPPRAARAPSGHGRRWRAATASSRRRAYAAMPMMERYGIAARADHRRAARHRHRAVRSGRGAPASGSALARALGAFARMSASCWRPGRVAPWNGQLILPDAARAAARATACATSSFVVVGENRSHADICARSFADAGAGARRRAMFRIVGHCRRHAGRTRRRRRRGRCPRSKPPVLGRVVAEAQAMGRPVVTSEVGMLPENMWSAAATCPRSCAPAGWSPRRCRSSSPGRSRAALTLDEHRLSRDGRAGAAIRRIHVLAAERRDGDPCGLHRRCWRATP